MRTKGVADTFQEKGIVYLMNGTQPRAAVTWIFPINVAAEVTDPDTCEGNGTLSSCGAVICAQDSMT
jgi:hypothetical protein